MNVKDYMKLPYDCVIRQVTDESGTYFHATVLELDGCQSTGETFNQAYEGLLEAMEGWIETKLQNDFPIPTPFNADNFSGKFLLNLPKSLFSRLTLEAKREGIPVDQYAVYKLAQ